MSQQVTTEQLKALARKLQSASKGSSNPWTYSAALEEAAHALGHKSYRHFLAAQEANNPPAAPQEPPVAPIPSIAPLFAVVQLERVEGKRGGLERIVDHGDPVNLDVTAEILKLPLPRLMQLQDNQYESDALAAPVLKQKDHDGPFRVDIEDALAQWLSAHNLPEREKLTPVQWDLFRFSQLRPFTVHWSKAYYASGAEEVRAFNEAHALEIADEHVGDWEGGGLQYAPEQNRFEIEEGTR